MHFVGSADERIAIQYVDNAVTVQVLLRVANAVLIEIPAISTTLSGGPGRTGGAVIAVVTGTGGEHEGHEDNAQKVKKAYFSTIRVSHFRNLRQFPVW
jgi:hypothetical protein